MSKTTIATLILAITIISIYGCKGRNVGTPQEDAGVEPSLEVSLDEVGSPPASNIPRNAPNIGYAMYNFRALDRDVRVTNLVLTRNGLGHPEDFSEVHIWVDNTQVSTTETFSNATNTSEFQLNQGELEIEANASVKMKADGNMDAYENSENRFCIMNAEDVTAEDAETGLLVGVTGEFPICGNFMTTTAVMLGTLEITEQYFGSTPVYVGDTEVDYMRVRIENLASEDVYLDPLAFYQLQTPQWGFDRVAMLISNLELAHVVDPISDTVLFNLQEPILLARGDSVEIQLRGDMINTDPEDLCRSVQWHFDQLDSVAIGAVYDFEVDFRRSPESQNAPYRPIVMDAAYFYSYDQHQEIVSPVAPGAQDTAIAVMKLHTGYDAYVPETEVQLEFQDPSHAAHISDLKLWRKNAQGIWEVAANMMQGPCIGTTCTYNSVDSFDILQCDQKGLMITLDVDANASAMQVRFKLIKSAIVMQRLSNGVPVDPTTEITGDAEMTGPWVQIVP